MMHSIRAVNKAAIIAAVGAALSLAYAALQIRVGFNLWDEGFLWYGVQRVMAGEVPVRDFMSYDIGRYYLLAAMMAALGSKSLISLRVALALLRALTVAVGTYLIVREDPRSRWLYGLLAAATLTIWMFVWHKIPDVSASIVLLAGLTIALHRLDRKGWFLAGLMVGLAALIGVNHALYGVIAALGGLLYVYWGKNWRHAAGAAAAGCTGMAVGYLPDLLTVAFVPGYAHAVEDGVRQIFANGATNIPLPVPWPWIAAVRSAPPGEAAWAVLLGSFFLALPLFGVCGVAYCAYARHRGRSVNPVFIAASLVSLPYAHYAFSRAGLNHLATGVFPLLIGVFAFPWARATPRMAAGGLLLVASLCLTGAFQPVFMAAQPSYRYEIEDRGISLLVLQSTAIEIGILRQLADNYLCPDQTFLAAPFWPGAYALLGRKAPVWENYALFPRSKEFQEAEIARIETANPVFAVINDTLLDNRPELGYGRTHPLLDQFIKLHFRPIELPGSPAYLRLYVRGDAQARSCSAQAETRRTD